MVRHSGSLLRDKEQLNIRINHLWAGVSMCQVNYVVLKIVRGQFT
jgi:hypothetical protein